MIFQTQIDALRDRYERLSQRERTLVGAFGASFVVFVTLIVAFFISDGLSSLEDLNAAMRQGNYSPELWKQITGKTAEELDEEWKQTLPHPATTRSS